MIWLERSCCISVSLYRQDECITDGVKPLAHPNQKLLLVIFDDAIWPETRAADVTGQKYPLNFQPWDGKTYLWVYWMNSLENKGI